jgi:plasmid stabilization system protein ParE
MPKVYQRAAARRDLVDHFVYLAENADLDTAERFLTKAEASISANIRQPSDIASRASQAFDEAGANRVAGTPHDNGDGAGRFLRRPDGLRWSGNDHIDSQLNQLLHQNRKAFVVALGEAPLDHQILPLHIAKLAHSPPERISIPSCIERILA